MRSLFQLILVPFTLGMALFGCGKSDSPPPPAPADVTLLVPGMN